MKTPEQWAEELVGSHWTYETCELVEAIRAEQREALIKRIRKTASGPGGQDSRTDAQNYGMEVAVKIIKDYSPTPKPTLQKREFK